MIKIVLKTCRIKEFYKTPDAPAVSRSCPETFPEALHKLFKRRQKLFQKLSRSIPDVFRGSPEAFQTSPGASGELLESF